MEKEYQSLKVGDRIVEFDLGMSIESTVIDPPLRTKHGDYIKWQWKTKTDDDKIIEYLRTEGYEHYCGEILKLN